MPHIRRVRAGFNPRTGRPDYGRELIVGGRVVMFDPCDPKDCPDHALMLDAAADARWRRDREWSLRRIRPGGVTFYRHR